MPRSVSQLFRKERKYLARLGEHKDRRYTDLDSNLLFIGPAIRAFSNSRVQDSQPLDHSSCTETAALTHLSTVILLDALVCVCPNEIGLILRVSRDSKGHSETSYGRRRAAISDISPRSRLAIGLFPPWSSCSGVRNTYLRGMAVPPYGNAI